MIFTLLNNDVLRYSNDQVLVGDLNASTSRLDHCDPEAFEEVGGPVFESRAGVLWLNGLIQREYLVDTFRHFYPTVTVMICA